MAENRWVMLAVLFLVRTTMAFQFQSIGSLGPVLVDAFGIDYLHLGTLIGLYLLPGVVFALPGGMLGDRFGSRRIVVAGLALMGAGGVMIGFSASFVPAVIGRLLSGAGAVLMNVMVTRMVADWFLGRELRTAMAILVASWPFGLALGLLGMAPLAEVAGWPAVMHGAALLCLLMLALVGVVYRDPPRERAGGDPAAALPLSRRELILVAFAGLIWGVYNVGYIVLISFLPALFAQNGHSLAAATSLVSLLGWALIASVPIGGYLADQSRRPNMIMVGGFLVTAAASAALPFMAQPGFAFAVILLAAGLPAGAVMALPASVLRSESRATGMGAYYTCYYAIMAGFPALAGLAQDLTGSEAAPVLFAAVMFLTALGGLLGFRLALNLPTPARA